MFDLYRKSFAGLAQSIWLLAIVLVINRSGTMVIPFMTVYLTSDLCYSFTQAGIVMSCFGLGSVLGSFLGGWLTDRIGFYYIQFWSLFFTGVSFFALSQVQGMVPLCITIFIVGLIADAFRPANYAAAAAYSKPENLTRSFSLLRIAVNIGMGIGPALGGVLIGYVGYEAIFIVDGITCIVASLVLLIFLPYRKSQEQSRVKVISKEPVRSAYRDEPYLVFTFMIFLTALAFMQFFTAVPVYLKEELFFNEAQIGGLIMINCFMIALMEMPLVYTLEKRFSRLSMVNAGALLIGLSFLVYLFSATGILLAIGFILIITVGEMLNMPFTNVIAMDRANDQNRGQYMAIFTIAFSCAHILAPSLGMYIAER